MSLDQNVDNNVVVTVYSEFLRDQTDYLKERFAFSYTITISNYGRIGARLLRRHWLITDANGGIQEVRGDGVVGEQPLIAPGRSYQYTSGALLPTPVGSMQGAYTMVNIKGEYFDAQIPVFSLAIPEMVN